MKHLRHFIVIALTAVLVTGVAGCKGQKQLQGQVADMETKMAESQKRMNALETELKRATFELNQIKTLVTKLGNVVVDLQKAEEERARLAAEAKARAKAPAKKVSARKSAIKKSRR